jgi:hypothetical protein
MFRGTPNVVHQMMSRQLEATPSEATPTPTESPEAMGRLFLATHRIRHGGRNTLPVDSRQAGTCDPELFADLGLECPFQTNSVRAVRTHQRLAQILHELRSFRQGTNLNRLQALHNEAHALVRVVDRQTKDDLSDAARETKEALAKLWDEISAVVSSSVSSFMSGFSNRMDELME